MKITIIDHDAITIKDMMTVIEISEFDEKLFENSSYESFIKNNKILINIGYDIKKTSYSCSLFDYKIIGYSCCIDRYDNKDEQMKYINNIIKSFLLLIKKNLIDLSIGTTLTEDIIMLLQTF